MHLPFDRGRDDRWPVSPDAIHPLHHWGELPNSPYEPWDLNALPYERNPSIDAVRRRDGVLIAPSSETSDSPAVVAIPSCLLDTGARLSFMSNNFANKNSHLFPIHKLATPTAVRLGDAKTVLPITHYVIATTLFHVKGKEHRGAIVYYLFDSGFDTIIGMPDILSYFATFLASQILMAAGAMSDEALQGFLHMISEYHHNPYGGDLISPWQRGRPPPSPEELSETVDPSLDSAYLHYLDKPYDDHVADFYKHLAHPKRFPNSEFSSLQSVQSMLFGGEFLDVFCPTEWHGIYPSAAPSSLPLDLKFMSSCPPSLKPFCPPTPERLRKPFLIEWARLKTYLYRPHSGPYGAPILPVPKPQLDGSMGCRPAGDFRGINVHIERMHEPVPRPEHVVAAVSKFRYKTDLDCKNGYHALPLSKATSEKLAVVGPDGQYAPNFLPEGVGPATSAFCRVMNEIFQDYINEGWCFVIIDNIILGADSIEESAHRLRLILERCRQSGLTLKIEKSFFCVDTCKFFGYEIGYNTHRMDDGRVQSLRDIPFPTSKTAMKSFLGSSVFFMKYVDHYNVLAAPLHDMTKDKFDWTDSDLRASYKPSFERLKEACATAVTLFAPNYDLPWLIRCDASIVGSGGVLLQQLPADHPKWPLEWVPIAFCSHKFSEVATRWSTIEQEAWAIYHSVCVAFRYFIFGKSFVVESDHRNLQWMESSVVPKIIRWRLALQEYDFLIKHIPGKQNVVADFFSRMYCISLDSLVSRPTDFLLVDRLDEWYDGYVPDHDFPDPTDPSSPLRFGFADYYRLDDDS